VMNLEVTGMSKHSSTFSTLEAVEVVVYEHVVVETVLTCECRAAYLTDKRLDTFMI